MALSLAIVCRAPRIITLQPATVEFVLGIVEQYECTFVFMVPPQIGMMLRLLDAKPFNLSKLTMIHCGGSALSGTAALAVKQKLPHVEAVSVYGMTDIYMVVAGRQAHNALDSVGCMTPGVHAKVSEMVRCDFLSENLLLPRRLKMRMANLWVPMRWEKFV